MLRAARTAGLPRLSECVSIPSGAPALSPGSNNLDSSFLRSLVTFNPCRAGRGFIFGAAFDWGGIARGVPWERI